VIVAGLDEPRRPHHTGGASAAPLFAAVARSQLAPEFVHAIERQSANFAQDGAVASDRTASRNDQHLIGETVTQAIQILAQHSVRGRINDAQSHYFGSGQTGSSRNILGRKVRPEIDNVPIF
jgi:hypothetical protein